MLTQWLFIDPCFGWTTSSIHTLVPAPCLAIYCSVFDHAIATLFDSFASTWKCKPEQLLFLVPFYLSPYLVETTTQQIDGTDRWTGNFCHNFLCMGRMWWRNFKPCEIFTILLCVRIIFFDYPWVACKLTINQTSATQAVKINGLINLNELFVPLWTTSFLTKH